MLKKHPTLGVWFTPKSGSAFSFFVKKKDRLSLVRRHVNFQHQNQFIKFIFSHLKKIIFNHFVYNLTYFLDQKMKCLVTQKIDLDPINIDLSDGKMLKILNLEWWASQFHGN